jgi:hypothetical protein
MEALIIWSVIIIGVVVVGIFYEAAKAAIEIHRERNRRCIHGIKRAQKDPLLCSHCTADAADRKQERAMGEASSPSG